MEDINIEDFRKAYERIKPFVLKTRLTKYSDNLYFKNESEQFTNSFKWSGVLYAVMIIFDNFVKTPSSNFFIVTQSTGNHGIATIRAVSILKNHYSKLYPNLKNKIKEISPVIFTNHFIKKNKLLKMKDELSKFYNKGFIDNSYKNYEESLNAREKFIDSNNSVYVAHGGKDIMTGYGAIAFHLDEQIPKDKSINFYCAVGAGGPIGIGLCLKYLRKVNFNIVQTKNFDSFNKSILSGKLEYNPKPTKISVSDGIAVDKPELFALSIARRIVDNTITVEEEKVLLLKSKFNYTGSTLISLKGFFEDNKSNKKAVNIILDCEGN